jgi:hypothetical protein
VKDLLKGGSNCFFMANIGIICVICGRGPVSHGSVWNEKLPEMEKKRGIPASFF